MGNVIGSAVKFCQAADTVEVGAVVEQEEAVVLVRDTGPGIAPAQLERIFDPYAKGTSKQAGTGLGLFIAKGIIESFGGRIEVSSTLGEGATFTLRLPLLPPRP